MNLKYLEILACPACKGRLNYDTQRNYLICTIEKIAYPIIDGIMMLENSHAIDLSNDAAQPIQSTGNL